MNHSSWKIASWFWGILFLVLTSFSPKASFNSSNSTLDAPTDVIFSAHDQLLGVGIQTPLVTLQSTHISFSLPEVDWNYSVFSSVEFVSQSAFHLATYKRENRHFTTVFSGAKIIFPFHYFW